MPAHTLDYDDPLFVHTSGWDGYGPDGKSRRMSYSSAASLSSNRAYFMPIRVFKPYPLQRFFWLNGAAAGTDYITIGLYDENLQHVAVSQRRISTAGANTIDFADPGIGIAAAMAQLNSASDATAYTTPTVTMKKGRLYLMFVQNTHGSDATAVNVMLPTSGGNGSHSFTSRSTVQFDGTLARTSIWSCVPDSDFSGTFDIGFGGVTQTGCTAFMAECVGVDTTTNHGIVQQVTNTGNDTAPNATLSAFGSARNGVFAAFGNDTTGSATTPETGWLEFADAGRNPPLAALEVQWRAENDTTPSGTITSSPWGVCAVELKALVAPVWVAPGLYHIALHQSGGTDAKFLYSSINSDQTPHNYLQSSLTLGLGGSITPASSAPRRHVLCGFTRRVSP